MDNGSIQANANIDTAADMDFPSAPNEQFGLLDVGLSLKSFILDGHFKTDLQDSVSHLGTVNFAGLSSLEAIAKLVTLINSIPVPSKLAGGLIISFGSVTLVDNDPMTSDDFNLFDMHAFDSIKQRNSTLTGRLGQAISAFNTGGFADALSHSLDANGNPHHARPRRLLLRHGPGQQEHRRLHRLPGPQRSVADYRRALGRPFTLVMLDLPAFSFGFSYSQFFPIIGPLGASITGSLGAKFDFAFGYDSFGLQKLTAPYDWNDQHGGPADKQAGNTPGGKRDTRGDGLSGGTTNSTAVTSPTLITDLSPAQVIQLEFAYWARILSGISNATLGATSTNDEILEGDALINGLTLSTFEFQNEYDWHFVLI